MLEIFIIQIYLLESHEIESKNIQKLKLLMRKMFKFILKIPQSSPFSKNVICHYKEKKKKVVHQHMCHILPFPQVFH